MAFLFIRLPSGFLPDEDQGIMIALVQGPSGATSARTEKGLDAIRDHFLSKEGDNVQGVFTVNGFSFAGTGQNTGIAFIPLKGWEDRAGARNKAQAIAGRAMGALSQFKDALIFAVVPPAVQELGNATGFDLELVDETGIGHAKLLAARNMMLGMASQDKNLAGVRPNALDDAPQLKVNVDHDKARALGLDAVDDQRHHFDRLGRRVCQRLHRPRPRQARLSRGGPAISASRPRTSVISTSAARRGRWRPSPPFPASPGRRHRYS